MNITNPEFVFYCRYEKMSKTVLHSVRARLQDIATSVISLYIRGKTEHTWSNICLIMGKAILSPFTRLHRYNIICSLSSLKFYFCPSFNTMTEGAVINV